MKKAVILTTVILLCMALIQSVCKDLSDAKDIVLAEYEGILDDDTLLAVRQYCKANRNIENVSIYRKPFLANARNFRDTVFDISVYEVDGSFQEFIKPKMLGGRFIWDSDGKGLDWYSVIDSETAVKLFGTPDCIGEEIDAGGRECKVLGIYEPEDSLLGFMASVHKAAVYVSLSLSNPAIAEYVLMFKVKAGASSIVANSLDADLWNILGGSVNVENIDIKARLALQKRSVAYALMVFIAAFYFLKWAYRRGKRIFAELQKERERHYLIQLLRNDWLMIVSCIAPFVIAIIILFSLVKISDFALVIDPAVIPVTLADAEIVRNTLESYFIAQNTAIPVASYFHAAVSWGSGVLTNTCIILVLCWWKICGSIFRVLTDMRADLHMGRAL